MRNSYNENVCEHSLEVGMLAHILTVISNRRFGSMLNPERAALYGMYHDSTEIITGDMPTPIKYYNKEMHSAYKEIEHNAAGKLLAMLPEDLREDFTNIFIQDEQDNYLWRLVKAADKLSALIKCIEEEKAGNHEFAQAKLTLADAVRSMDLKETDVFMEEFLPSYSRTLDELKQ